jgi:hypothetical protein
MFACFRGTRRRKRQGTAGTISDRIRVERKRLSANGHRVREKNEVLRQLEEVDSGRSDGLHGTEVERDKNGIRPDTRRIDPSHPVAGAPVDIGVPKVPSVNCFPVESRYDTSGGVVIV